MSYQAALREALEEFRRWEVSPKPVRVWWGNTPVTYYVPGRETHCLDCGRKLVQPDEPSPTWHWANVCGTCRSRRTRAKLPPCPCGGRRSSRNRPCWACLDKLRRHPRRHVQCACGRLLNQRKYNGRTCTTCYMRKYRAAQTPCACGRRRDPYYDKCRQCLAVDAPTRPPCADCGEKPASYGRSRCRACLRRRYVQGEKGRANLRKRAALRCARQMQDPVAREKLRAKWRAADARKRERGLAA